ncbi:MAG TPA: DUF1206 domain-containing protein [Marmoricola sp.]|nr:DUF1206 domain-containing protein [Marmoricola sp.]
MGTGELVAGSQRGADAVVKGVQVGLVAYGATHLVIAAAALPLAWGDRTEGRANQQGALARMAEQPLGDVLLWIIVLGMACLVVWQLGEAVLGHREDEGGKRLFKRVASAGRAVIYAVLGWTAARTAMGTGTSSGSGSTDGVTARLMSAPGGTLLVGAVGLAIVGVGVFLAYRGWAEKFTRHLQTRATQGDTRTPVVVFGKVGYIAKGAALAAIGGLFLTAAVQHQPAESGGLDVALHELLRQPFGPLLLAIVAVGLGCFGVYCFFWARYLRR